MKKFFPIAFTAIVFLSISFLMGFQFGSDNARKKANLRAVEMILNDEIPNCYMVVGTVDFLINNKSGDLQIELEKAQKKSKNKKQNEKN